MLSNLAIVYGKHNAACDRNGTCMVGDALYVKDNSHVNVSNVGQSNINVRAGLQAKDNGSASIDFKGIKLGGSWADVKDNSNINISDVGRSNISVLAGLQAKDNASVDFGFKGFKGGVKFADNSTVCDSRGNCIVRDSLENRNYPKCCNCYETDGKT